MLKQRRNAVEAVRAEFLPAEKAADDAAIKAARCLATMLEARASSGVPIGTGLAAINLLARSASLALETRQAMIEAHRELAALPAQIGLRELAWGPATDCPPVGVADVPAEAHLTLVSDAA